MKKRENWFEFEAFVMKIKINKEIYVQSINLSDSDSSSVTRRIFTRDVNPIGIVLIISR